MTPFLPHLLYSFFLILPYFYAPNKCFSFIGALIPHRYDYLLFYLINTYDCNKQDFTSWIMLISWILWRLFKMWRIQVHHVKWFLEEMNLYCQLCPWNPSLQLKCSQRSSFYASCNNQGCSRLGLSNTPLFNGRCNRQSDSWSGSVISLSAHATDFLYSFILFVPHL